MHLLEQWRVLALKHRRTREDYFQMVKSRQTYPRNAVEVTSRRSRGDLSPQK